LIENYGPYPISSLIEAGTLAFPSLLAQILQAWVFTVKDEAKHAFPDRVCPEKHKGTGYHDSITARYVFPASYFASLGKAD
jgi:hypothetical protein